MEFKQLTESEFKKHSQENEGATFLQTVEMAKLREKRGWRVTYVGLVEKGEVKASALLAQMKIRFGYYAEIDGGFLGDYQEKDLVRQFVQGLKEYLKKEQVLYLTMKPNITYQKYDWHGKKLGENKKEVLDQLLSLGFQHQGFTRGFSSGTPRWLFVKDVRGHDEKSLRKSYQKDALYSVKKTNQFGIQLRELPYDELDSFKKLTAHTAKRRGFQDKPFDYYQAVYQEFGKKAKFMVAEINFATYIHNLKQREEVLKGQLNTIEENLEKTPNSSKMQNKKREFTDQLQTQEKRIKEAEGFKEEVGEKDVLLAGALFLLEKTEVTYLFSGTYEKYKNFYAPFLIQDAMLQQTIQLGIPRYNFYGIEGIFDGSSGVLKFKQSFSGEVEEKIGSFDLVIKPVRYKMYQHLRRFVDKIRSS